MSHVTLKNSYKTLSDRLNLFPQGAPPSELLFRILEVLFTREEAALVALLPIKPFNVAAAANVWKKPAAESRKILEGLASKGMLLDMESNGEQIFVLPPPMAGFFEFSMMRMGNGYDQKLLAELYYQYLNVEEDFVKNLFAGGETQLGRTFVNEGALDGDNTLTVMDYERASEVIQTASHMGIGSCYCRHKMQHLDKACAAPMDICMTFNGTAQSLIKHGHARQVDVKEGMDLLQVAREHNLVQFGENVRHKVAFICNCCGCCCEAMIAARRFGLLHPVHTTNFLPEIQEGNCTGCGQCVNVCPVDAMSLISANNPHKPKARIARLREEICLGCCLCANACPRKHITLKFRSRRVITPLNFAHLAVVMAIERGKLQNLIFDNQALFSHRAMAAILGVILKLPPLKQAMANRQLKSRYLEALISRLNAKDKPQSFK